MAGSNHFSNPAVTDDLVNGQVSDQLSSLKACRDNWGVAIKARLAVQSVAMSMDASLTRFQQKMNDVMEHNAFKVWDARQKMKLIDKVSQESAYHSIDCKQFERYSQEEVTVAENLSEKFEKLFRSRLILSRTFSSPDGAETLINGDISVSDESSDGQDNAFSSGDAKRLIALMLVLLEVDSDPFEAYLASKYSAIPHFSSVDSDQIAESFPAEPASPESIAGSHF